MKRKVVKLSGLRLSPNEEAFLIKEEHERRRRLRIKQVREQERSIAVQIREEIKHRRNQQLEQLANELKAEWQMAQMEKAQSLEKLYLSGLKAVGEGHRQAKENEPDLKAPSKQAAVNREKAEKRHREALRELKQQKDKEHEVQNRYIKTRKKALLIEKKRALKIAQLPPPPPNPLADLEVQKYPAVKMYDIDSFSETRYHLPEPFVDRESDTPQISAQQTAQEEAKRLEDLQQEAEMERLEQLEKARLRGSYALQLVHLIQDKEKLVKELGEMQQADLARRRQIVPRMPPQLFEQPYRLVQVKEDRQREMEFAFEDMYAGDQKVRGDLILRLEHEPLPAPAIGVQDEDLDLSVEPDGFQKEEQDGSTTQNDLPTLHSGKIRDLGLVASSQPLTCQSNAALKKLFTKIKTQRDHCSKPEPKCVSKDMTIESGSITSGQNDQRTLMKSTANNLSEEHLEIPSVLIQANKQQNEVCEDAIKAGIATLCHPKEQATRTRSEIDRRKQLHELEYKKQQQLHLIWQSGQQKLNREPQVQGIQLQQQQNEEIRMQERVNSDLEKRSQQQDVQTKEWLRCQEPRKENTLYEQSTWRSKAAQVVKGNPHVNTELDHHKHSLTNEPSPDDEHMCTIHQYQQHLIEQNRLHKTSLEGIRKQLDEYRLKKGWSFVSTTARHLSEQQLPSSINNYDKSIGSELKVDVTRNKPEVTCALSAQYANFENRSRTLCQSQPITVPFVHLQQTKLPYEFPCQSLPDLNTGPTKDNFQLKNEDQLEDLQLTTSLNVPTCKGSYFSASQNVEALSREDQYRRPSKPPVTKIRLGLFGLFDQHELSAIQEGESPKSDRLSLFVNRNTPLDNCCCSEAEESRPKLIDSSCSSEIDLSNVSTSSSHQMSNISNCTVDSLRMSRMTWREKLKLEISSLAGQGSSHVESSMLAFAGPTDHTASKVLFPCSWSGNIQKAPEESQLFSTTLSTGSLPSSEPTDIGPVSPGDHSPTAHDIITGQSTAPSTSTSLSVNKDTVENQDIDHCCPSLEECIPTGRKIQQVVEKYTRSLNQWLNSTGKNQDPPIGHNTSTQGVPNFHLELQSPDSDLEFQPLETIPDFGFSSTSLSSTSSKNRNVLDTDRNTQNQHSNSTTNSEIKSFTDSIEFTPDHGSAVCNANQGSNCIQQNYDVENGRLNTFQPLQLKISSSKYSLDTDGSSENVMCNRYSEQGFNNCASSIHSLCFPPLDLIRQETVAAASQTLESTDQPSCSENTQEHFGSFSQLNVTLSSENDHNCDIPNQNGKHLENCESITSHAITFTENIKSKKVNEVSTLNGQTTELSRLISLRKRNCTGSEVLCVSERNHMVQSGLLPCGRTETAAKPEFKTEQDQRLSSNLASEVCTLHSIIPAREIESNIGIMEEPELSQLSLNDSTLVDEELELTSPIKSNTSLNEFQTFTQVNELQPSKLKITDAITSLHNLEVADCKINHMASSQNSPKAMIFQLDSPKILNEVVLKKKHKFLANSKKRVEDMKRKGRSGEINSELLNRKMSLQQEQSSVISSSSSVAAHLKMVGEVKVSTPEDRKAAEVEMRERTFRLYSQLDEVKTRKKEMTRQIECTRNREKAKEFQKKTLEKLRAMKRHR
ncbi:uncharacterized protein cep295 isoform X6 [Chiloscyllium punctatum]|uniref:uncharacterized protein cep295 isoform X6 n=1 Tax=Chiloscyllium punctatum TaxID=137246 RepID=UPI003B6389C8